MRPVITHISWAGPFYEIMVRGKLLKFEDHRYCGPMPVNKRTLNGIDLVPRHPFWGVVSTWYQAGKPMNKDGTCYVPDVHQPTPQRAGETGPKTP